MKENKEAKISFLGAHFTTIVSVSLVLIIAGLIALISLGARNETARLKEKVELTLIMADNISDKQAEKFHDTFRHLPYVATSRLISSQEALDNWTEETGENLEETFGINILSPEISFTLKSPYVSTDSVAAISNRLSKIQAVEGVASPDNTMLAGMNSNIERLLWMLGIVAAGMLVISFILINNTVHLTIYSRRFTIHTMQLVGATDNFIRRPFVVSNMMAGLISGVIASLVLAGLLGWAYSCNVPTLKSCVSWTDSVIIFIGMIFTGMAICSLAALISTTRYLHRDYDKLFS